MLSVVEIDELIGQLAPPLHPDRAVPAAVRADAERRVYPGPSSAG